MKDTHLYRGADFCCKAAGHWCLVTDEQAACFCYRLKKEEDKKNTVRHLNDLGPLSFCEYLSIFLRKSVHVRA